MIRDYGELIDALTARRYELGLTQADVDARAGFCDRYTSKIEGWRGKHGRGLGILTLPLLLQTLGVVLRLVPVEQRILDKPKRALSRDEHKLRVSRRYRRRDRRFAPKGKTKRGQLSQ